MFHNLMGVFDTADRDQHDNETTADVKSEMNKVKTLFFVDPPTEDEMKVSILFKPPGLCTPII